MKSQSKQQSKKMEAKTVRQIVVSLLKSEEGQKIINDLSEQIPELAALKFKGIKV